MIEEKENGKKEREEEREKEKKEIREGKTREVDKQENAKKIQSRLCKVALKLKKGSEELELIVLVDCFAKALLGFLHGR